MTSTDFDVDVPQSYRLHRPWPMVVAHLALLAVGTVVLAAPWVLAVLYPGPRTALAAIASFVIPIPIFIAVVVHRSNTRNHHSPTTTRRKETRR